VARPVCDLLILTYCSVLGWESFSMTGAHLPWKQMVLPETLFQNYRRIKSIAVHENLRNLYL